MRFLFIFSFLLIICYSALTIYQVHKKTRDIPVVVAEGEEKDGAQEERPFTLTQGVFDDLPDWNADDLDGFLQAFSRSCARIVRKSPDSKFGVLAQAGTYRKWQEICSVLDQKEFADSAALRSFIEEHFVPYQVSAGGNPLGLFTGYYEASLKGSRTKKPPYLTPLYGRPDDLVMVQLGDFRENLKGNRIAGRVVNGRLRPFESREEIVTDDYRGAQPLIWVDSPVDAFFVQIQGSGLVEMDDGSLLRIGYDGQNGHPYYAIGRELIKMGALTKETVSMQSIRQWLELNPAHADDIMNTNASYVFFREITGDGPIGAENVALTAKRSLAVDRTLISYGVPLWLDVDAPMEGENRLRRLMIAQDTGGAIVGAVRGDVFWGHGAYAEKMAGHMASQGRYWMLLPK